MNAHKNARATPFGRAVMVRRVLEEGWSVVAVASAFEVSTRTVRKWLARFCSEGATGLQNRSSAPRLVANKLPAPWLAMVTRLRREYRMTGEEIAERLRLPRSTVASHLRRLGLGRLLATSVRNRPLIRTRVMRPAMLRGARRIYDRLTGWASM
jgi:transposase